MQKHIFSLFSLLFLAQITWAIDPSTDLQSYYSSADGKSGEAIRSALSDKIRTHTTVSYDNLKYLFKWTDTYNNAGQVIDDIYSECDPAYTESWCSGTCGYNREHSLPKSWFGEATPQYSDAFHLYPTNCYVNSYRGNLAFGECAGGSKCTTNGVKAKGRRGASTFEYGGHQYTFSQEVYEPDDEFKGDLARSYFYMVTCYITTNFGQADGGEIMFDYSGNKAQLSQYSIDLLLKWHRQDPVSERELVRNEVIYGNKTYNKCDYSQGNRNPFIDYPCLAEYIWGEHKGETLNLATLVSGYDAVGTDCCGTATAPAITSPKETIDFGTTDTEHTVMEDINIKGVNLENGNLTLTLSGENAAYFSLATNTVTNAQAENGYNVTVSYAPTAEGNHTATLTISGCGVANHIVLLTGKCTQVHTITWVDDQGQQTTMAATGEDLVLPANQPADCSTDRVFRGWTAQTAVSAEPTDLFTEPSGTVSAPATYYAVYADKTVEGGGEQVISKAASIAVGDKVIVVCEDVSKELSGFSTASTIYGLATAYNTTPVGTLTFDVLEGKSSGTFAFKNGNDYLNWSSGNSLSTATALSDNTSWKVTIISGNATMLNARDNTRRILWNKSSPRFACYTQSPGTNYYNIQLYKLTGGTTITYSNYSLTCDDVVTGLNIRPEGQIAHKVLVGGHIYIQIGEQLFTITGQRVK